MAPGLRWRWSGKKERLNRAASLGLTGLCLALAAASTAGCSRSRSRTFSSTTSSTTSGTSSAPTSSSSTAPAATTSAPLPPPTPPPAPAGSGQFVDGGARLPDSLLNDWTVAAGDVDGDGRVDLAIGTYDGGLRLLLNKVTGFVEAGNAFPAGPFKSCDLHLIDMDGDADLDAVLASNFEPVRVFANDGTGLFTLKAQVPATNGCFTYKIAVGDANGDARPDVFMANAGQNTPSRGLNLLLLNDGTGGLTMAPAGALPDQREDTIGAVFMDVDGDGDRDVYVANFGVPGRILVNDGKGAFVDQSDARLPAGLRRGSTSVVAADFTKDGFVDLFVTNQGLPGANGTPPPGEPNTLLVNDGTGRFTDMGATLLPGQPDSSFNARAADFDGDGWIDLAVSNLRAPQRLWLNKQGVFVDSPQNLPAPAQAPGGDSLGLAVADLDGNQTPDLVWVRRGLKPWLFLNVPK